MPYPSKDQSIPIFTRLLLTCCVDLCPPSSLPTGPEGQGGSACGGGSRGREGASCFYSGTWFIGLQGMKVNKGRKTKSSISSPLNSHPLETRSRVPYREKLVGHEGDTQAKHLEKLGSLWASGSSQD